MPGTQADAVDMVATALDLPNLPVYVMKALGAAGDLITEQRDTIERLEDAPLARRVAQLANENERLRAALEKEKKQNENATRLFGRLHTRIDELEAARDRAALTESEVDDEP